jgi:hypothetical protein
VTLDETGLELLERGGHGRKVRSLALYAELAPLNGAAAEENEFGERMILTCRPKGKPSRKWPVGWPRRER